MISAVAQDVDEEANTVEVLTEQILKNNPALKEQQEALKDVVSMSIKYQKAMENLADTVEDNEDELKKWAKSTTKGVEDMSIKTARAVGALKTSLQGVFGDDVEISNDFIHDNFEEIQKVIKGDEKALDDLEKKLNNQYLLDIGINISGFDQVDEIQYALDTLADKDYEVGVSLDDEKALAGLQNFFAQAKLSQEDAQKVLNQFGWEGELEEVKEPGQKVWESVPVYSMSTQTYSFPQTYETPNLSGGGTKTYKTQNTYTLPNQSVTFEDVSHEVPGRSYFVLKSKNGSSTHGNIQTSGLGGSVKSTGKGAARQSAVKNYGGGSKKSGGGGDNKPDKMDPLKEEIDRYHKVNTQITKVGNNLKKLQSQQDKFVGKKKIDNLNAQ